MKSQKRVVSAYFYSYCLFIKLTMCLLLGETFPLAYAESDNASTVIVQKEKGPFSDFKRFIPANQWMVLSDKTSIPLRTWEAAAPKAIILAFHGFNDSRDAWESSAPILAKNGITVYAPDQRGFGQTSARGYWAGKKLMLQDIREEVGFIHNKYPNLPLYLMGESMGGALLMCLAAQKDAPFVNGYILLAPAVLGYKQIGLPATVSLYFLKEVSPQWKITGRELPLHILASDNRAALLRLYYDPLSLRETRIDTLSGLVSLMNQAVKSAPQVRFPMLIIYGGKDQLVPDYAMKNTWKHLPNWVRKDYIPDGYHLLLRDKDRNIVISDILAWINDPDQWLPSGGDVASATWGSMGKSASIPFYLPAQLDKVIPLTHSISSNPSSY